ncbi:MAG: hypothetical protein RL376_401 [Verrucomicrobiota bacterium]|jgi:Spy/CpxP family protein refolding chaperone
MKTKTYALMISSLLAAGALFAATANAQSPAGNTEKPVGKERRERSEKSGPGGERGDRLEKMREHLGLTDEQVAKLKPIFAAEFEEMKAKREELGKDATRDERRAAMEALRDKYQPQIDAVLTAEQKAKVEKMRERGPGGPGGPEGKERPRKNQE